jgi:membrane-associated phospholipid phosphatase
MKDKKEPLRHLQKLEHEFWTDLSFFGSSICYVFIIILLLTFAHYKLAFKFTVLLCIMYAVTTLIRLTYYKKRPIPEKNDTFFERIDSSSFPSMHSMRTTSLYTWIILFAAPVAFISFAGVLTILALLSRIMLGKHDIIDVFAGGLIGVLLTILVHVFL